MKSAHPFHAPQSFSPSSLETMSDHLTSLPFELFEMIVQLAQANPQTKTLYVSKAFRPFARRHLFESTKIRSYGRLATLFDLITTDKAIVPFIKTLDISLKGEKDPGVPKDRALTTGFAHLFATEIVGIEYSSRIAKTVLSPLNERSLISMRSLMIKDPLDGFQNPLDPSHYRWLERYTNLYSFELAITRDVNEIGRKRRSSSNAEDSTNWQIGYLGLEAPCINNPSIHDFISFFPNIVSFDIFERTDDGTSCLLPILSQIDTPEDLDYLQLMSYAEPEEPEDLSRILPRFKNLSYLDFGPGTLHNKSFNLLNHSTFPHLEILSLRYGVDISTVQIKSLITGDKKLSNLRCVSLALIMKDPEIYGEGDYERDFDMGGWLAPLGFTAKFTPKGLEEIVEVADREGMHLEGYAVSFARREIESRKKDAKGRSNWERKMGFY